MDYDALEKAITERTKAISPVELAGIPCDFDWIMAIVESKKNPFEAATEDRCKNSRFYHKLHKNRYV